MKYIPAEELIAKVEGLKEPYHPYLDDFENGCREGRNNAIDDVLFSIRSLQHEQPIIEEDWVEKRKQECECRRLSANGNYQCERYEGVFGPCDGRCSWIVDYPKLKELEEREQPTKGFDKDYLNKKIAKASETWKGVDVDKYMDEVRGREHAQPEVYMEKFTEKIQTFQGRYKYPESISIKGAMAFMARMFYQYPNVARLWYEQMPKATMDNARKEEKK